LTVRRGAVRGVGAGAANDMNWHLRRRPISFRYVWDFELDPAASLLSYLHLYRDKYVEY
jgi:hypothetical protein